MTPASTIALIHSDDYANWVFDSHHPTQGRRFMKARELLLRQAPEHGISVLEIESDYFPTREQLEAVHDPDYIDDVLVHGRSGEWTGQCPDLANLAHRMAGGTFLAAQALLDGKALTAVNFAGAKHHAMADHSSGFCVFNDHALVARYLLEDNDDVHRIAIIDFDAHHGDGTEELLRNEPNALTFSIHDSTIFPWTGHTEDPSRLAFNRPLESQAGDRELLAGIEDFLQIATNFKPDLVFVAMGADGHITDPLSTLTYSIDGMVATISETRSAFPETPMLLGGAGGYQPDSITPQAWAMMAVACAQSCQ